MCRVSRGGPRVWSDCQRTRTHTHPQESKLEFRGKRWFLALTTISLLLRAAFFFYSPFVPPPPTMVVCVYIVVNHLLEVRRVCVPLCALPVWWLSHLSRTHPHTHTLTHTNVVQVLFYMGFFLLLLFWIETYSSLSRGTVSDEQSLLPHAARVFFILFISHLVLVCVTFAFLFLLWAQESESRLLLLDAIMAGWTDLLALALPVLYTVYGVKLVRLLRTALVQVCARDVLLVSDCTTV